MITPRPYRRDTFLGIVLITTCLLSCSDKKTPTGPERLNTAGFPLAIGNSWTYSVTSIREIRTSGEITLADTADVQVTWTVEAQEQVLGINAFRMKTVSFHNSGPDSGRTWSGETWFATIGDTLKGVASTGGISPVVAQLLKPLLAGSREAIGPWGINVLVFPLREGAVWDFSTHLFESDRKVVEAVELISTPAGDFAAFPVVRLANTPGFELQTRQWFGVIGIVKMEHEIIFVTDLQDPSGHIIEVGGVVVKERVRMALESTTVPESG